MIFSNDNNWSLEAIEMNLLYGVDIWSAEAAAESSGSRHQGTHASSRHHRRATHRSHASKRHDKLCQVKWQDLEL
jgi:hypothetical protein